MEKSLISKLKIEVGYNSVRKMENMFKDMENSRQVMKSYKDSKKNQDVELNVEVLTSGQWPYNEENDLVKLTPVLQSCQVQFEQFYKNKHKGKHL